jgi:hypothetical protein
VWPVKGEAIDAKQKIRPSWWYCAFGVAALAAGVGLFAFILYRTLSKVSDDMTEMVFPGEKDLSLAPHRNYTIFLETTAFIDGRIYSSSGDAEGLRCSITEKPSGAPIPLVQPHSTETYDMEGRSGKSLLNFTTTYSRLYHMACAYDDETGHSVALAIASGMEEKLIGGVFGGMAAMLGGIISCAAIVITVVLLRERSKKRLAT